MKKPFYLLILICSFFVNFSAQTPQNLTLSQTIEHEINGGEIHLFSFRTEANKAIQIMLFQQGIDVYTVALNAEKKKIAEVDSQNGRNGPEKLEFVVDTAGEYFIEVRTSKGVPSGKFKITLAEIRNATDDDRARGQANNIFWAANDLRQKRTAESLKNAITQFNQALTIYEKLNDIGGRAYSYSSLGMSYESLGDYKKALELYSLALPLWQEVGNKPSEATALSRIGVMHYYLGNSQESLEWSNKALKLMFENGNNIGVANTYNNLAVVYNRLGENLKAIEQYEKALKVQLETGSKENAAISLGNIGVAYLGLSDYEKALDKQQEALELWRELKFKADEGFTLIEIGVIYQAKGENQKALTFFQQALPLCLESGDKNCEAKAYVNYTSSYRFLGEMQNALDFAMKAVGIYRTRGQNSGLGRTLNEIGLLYTSLGDDKRAAESFNESLEIFVKAQNRYDEAILLTNLALLYKRDGNLAKASEFHHRSLNIRREIKDLGGQAVSLNGLGILELAQEHYDSAGKLFEESLEIYIKTGSKVAQANTLVNLGISSYGLGKTTQSLDYFNRALTGFRETEVKSDEAFTLYQISAVQKRTGNIDEAIKNIEGAIAIVETLRGNIAATDLRASYFAGVQKYYELYIELLMLKHKEKPDEKFDLKAFQVSEVARARSLLDLLQDAKADLKGNVDPNLLAREKELIEQINAKAARQIQAFNDPKKKDAAKTLTDEINRLSTEYETVQAQIKKTNPRYSEITKKVELSLSKIQEVLDAKTILAEFKLGENKSFLWLVTRDKIESYELPDQAEIEAAGKLVYQNLIERNRQVVGETNEQHGLRLKNSDLELQENTAKLREILFGKIKTQVANKTVAVIADGILQFIPFNLLLESSEVVSLPSLNVLAEIRGRNDRQKTTKTIAIFADPIFESNDTRFNNNSVNANQVSKSTDLRKTLRDFELGDKFPRLLSTRLEAQNIILLTPKNQSDLQLDFDANRDNVINQDLSNYKIIHFATHGLLNASRPELSGLVFSLYDKDGVAKDGFLRLNQIYNLNLNSDLVVLSACQTALGKDVRGEGLIGLTRGFMYAGAKRIIATLWKVDDAATAEFMKRFYQNLLVKKLNPVSALHQTQNEIKQIPRFKSPYFWAGFTIQGDWK